MCGRYHFNILPDKKGKAIKERAEKLKLTYKEGEIFPTDNVLCIVPFENKIDLKVKRWGIKAKTLLINAREETIDERSTYKKIKNNRCALIMNGFYEWDKEKNKYYISFNRKYMYLACIFNKANELVVITREATPNFKNIHDRLPVIMNQEEMLEYIHGSTKTITDKELLIEKCIEKVKLF